MADVENTTEEQNFHTENEVMDSHEEVQEEQMDVDQEPELDK